MLCNSDPNATDSIQLANDLNCVPCFLASSVFLEEAHPRWLSWLPHAEPFVCLQAIFA